ETVSGDSFTVTTKNDSVVIMDAKGNTSTIVKTDVKSSNGVIHVIDTVILP
ncbi:MAG: fasciclin domain-containing protein, partial [Bacteroidetes bacterium]|nr:fasciclin domain-containing protein [Bacteroidota bacterium]